MTQVDPSSALVTLIQGLIDSNTSSLCVSFPCKVISFNDATCMAVVQPLLKTMGEADPSPIQNVPALGQRFMIDGMERIYKPSLRAGDAVLVVCSDRELTKVLSGQVAQPDSKRMHSHNDAIIVGVMPCSLQN